MSTQHPAHHTTHWVCDLRQVASVSSAVKGRRCCPCGGHCEGDRSWLVWSPLSSTWYPVSALDSRGDHALLVPGAPQWGTVVGVALFPCARLRAQSVPSVSRPGLAYLQVFNIQNQENSSWLILGCHQWLGLKLSCSREGL